MRRRTLLYSACVLCLSLICTAQQPEDPYTQHLRDGATETAQGNFSAAMADIQAARALRPDDAAGWYELGSLLGQTGDFPGAEAAFRQAILLQPDMAKAHYGLALTLIGNPQNKEDWPSAIAECREALKLRPDYPEALNLLGAGLNKIAQPDAAIEVLERAIQLSPSLAQAHFNLGLALESNDRLDDAAKEYRAAVAAKGEYAEASSALGRLLLRMGKTESAEQEVERALRSNPDLTDAQYTRARILQSLHRNQDAAIEFAIAKDLTERQANGIQSSQRSNQGLELAKKGDMAGAASTLKKAIALKPDYGVPHFNLGLIMADQGQNAAAIQELSKAASLLPGQAAPWFELGRVLSLSKDNRGALELTAWAAHLDPSNAAVQSELRRLRASVPFAASEADVLSQPKFGAASDIAAAHVAFAEELIKQGDDQGAAGELLRALALQPANKDARSKLAAAYANLGQKDRAVLEYQKLLLAFPDDAPGHIALGKILLSQRKPSGAAEQFKLALILDPESREARGGLQSADHPAPQR
jgi:tetratricopeptide (TPR) repeat protein